MEKKLQEMADTLTSEFMSYKYGERFDECEDITKDEEMNKDWDFLNERIFGIIWAAYDEGYDVGFSDAESEK